jgi:hypothetical protein
MTAMKEKQIVLIPGLGDNVTALRFATQSWEKHGVKTHIQRVGWYDGEEFEPKFERMLSFIDQLLKNGSVSVIGTSAGGSFAFNVFQEYKDKVDKGINVCGRLRTGHPHRTFRSLEAVTKGTPAFRQSVLRFEENEKLLSVNDRSRLMTIRPAFGDEAVPPETVPVEGALNTLVYTPEHIAGIGLSLLFPSAIFNFLSDKS